MLNFFFYKAVLTIVICFDKDFLLGKSSALGNSTSIHIDTLFWSRRGSQTQPKYISITHSHRWSLPVKRIQFFFNKKRRRYRYSISSSCFKFINIKVYLKTYIAINTPNTMTRHAPTIPPMEIGRLSNEEQESKVSCSVTICSCKL